MLKHLSLLIALLSTAGLCAEEPNTRHVTVPEAAELIDRQQAIVLDIRTLGEFRRGHIPGAMNIDFYQSDFLIRLDKLDRAATYVLTCETGVRSAMALRSLDQLGFENIAHLQQGMAGWRSKGLPLEL